MSASAIALNVSIVCVPLILGALVLDWSRPLTVWILPDPDTRLQAANVLDMSQLHAVDLPVAGMLLVVRRNFFVRLFHKSRKFGLD